MRSNLTTLLLLLLDLQHEISLNIDNGKFHGLASLDLLAAFGMVNPKLFIKRMMTAGPNDITTLIFDWLTNCVAYVDVGS